jgi:hypothetical protein
MTEKKEYPNSGIFFVNTRKRPDKKDCDYDGNGEITCDKCGHKNSFFINIWSKVGTKGDFWSILFKPKTGAPASQGSSLGSKSLSSGAQQDMGYSRETPPRDEPRGQAPRRDFGKDISDDIPFSPQVD